MKLNFSKIGIIFLIALVIIVFKISTLKEETNTPFVKAEKIEKTTNSPSIKQNNSSITEHIINDAKTYLRVPHRYGGNTRKGMDCSGLVQLVFKKNGIDLPRSSADQAKKGKALKINEVVPGDLLFFITSENSRKINHVGIVTEINGKDIKFIHTSSKKGVVISSFTENYWNKTYVKAKRVL